MTIWFLIVFFAATDARQAEVGEPMTVHLTKQSCESTGAHRVHVYAGREFRCLEFVAGSRQ
jgi:hypothetical protein